MQLSPDTLRTLLFLSLSHADLADYQPVNLPGHIRQYLRQANRATLLSCLVEIIQHLNNCDHTSPPAGG
ncbi:MAG: hypothetical protein IT443_04530 [Phycisphaeraceae bacterium]|nr:hypothetical protein [Phycisphaeraceae bacterium]